MWPVLFQHYAHCVLEPDWIVRRIRRQEEHVALVNVDIAELVVVDDFEQHGALVLVEPFRGLVDVVVGALVGAAHDHDGDAVIVDAVVVYGRLEHVRVLGNPGYVRTARKEGGAQYHFGTLSGGARSRAGAVREK